MSLKPSMTLYCDKIRESLDSSTASPRLKLKTRSGIVLEMALAPENELTFSYLQNISSHNSLEFRTQEYPTSLSRFGTFVLGKEVT